MHPKIAFRVVKLPFLFVERPYQARPESEYKYSQAQCLSIRIQHPMNILFIHQNFPGQFKHLASALTSLGHQVKAMTMNAIKHSQWQGVQLLPYTAQRSSTPNIHPWVADFETKVVRAEACLRAAMQLKNVGFEPDIIIAHPGWGESLFIKDVWPTARLGIYCEFFYQPQGCDVGFDPEFAASDIGDAARILLKNTNNLLHFAIADAALSPTHWQASTFPEPFRSRISVVHDGIDTDALAPNPKVQMTLTTSQGEQIKLTRQSEIITFVNRNLEPYRGYHTLMRALPDILKQRPQARVLLVGASGVSYGARPDTAQHGNKSWKDVFADEVRGRISDADWSRVHFLGQLPYSNYVELLQLSSVHVYLTYPFVLSWSLLEAMSIGCAIVASGTAPVREAISQDQTGRLVDFFDAPALAREVCSLLDSPTDRARLGQQARESTRARYDLKTVCLPGQLQWALSLAA